MKKNVLLPVLLLFFLPCLHAQVTQINSNQSLEFEYPLTSNKAVYVSAIDKTLWATDGTPGGTLQLSTSIKFVNNFAGINYLDGKMIFAGTTPAIGSELFITDGTPGGTQLLSDIYPGTTGSEPDDDAAVLNGYVYFTAVTAGEGRELWRTNGTPGGTSLVKDILAGTGGSNNAGDYHLFSTGTYLLMMARTATNGIELWRSDGTNAGTVLLKDINVGTASSNIQDFYKLNSLALFSVDDGISGKELWKSDGTPGGTTIVKDINPGLAGSSPLFGFGVNFFEFGGKAYFTANDGVHGEEIWVTDGTTGNTNLLKDIETGPLGSVDLIYNSVILPGKFIFSSTDLLGTRYGLWESDGTTAGTKPFIAFDGDEPPFLLPSYIASNSFAVSQLLFQGNKFFFIANTAAEGYELWISDGVDGTPAHTQLVKSILPGTGNGVDLGNLSYLYTTSGLFFPGFSTANGVELWKSDGTTAGTNIVADIITGPTGSVPGLSFFIINNKVIFEATNGDNPARDLFAVDGNFTPLPVKLGDFTVAAKGADAQLNWYTLQETNSSNFTLQRSMDGVNFSSIGTVAAAGNATRRNNYMFTDPGIVNSGQVVIYYRLLLNDIDGKSTTSAVITLRLTAGSGWKVQLMANPVADQARLLLAGITSRVQLSIFDVNGKKLLVHSPGALNGQVTLPVGNLPAGVYLLLVETATERKTIRFVK